MDGTVRRSLRLDVLETDGHILVQTSASDVTLHSDRPDDVHASISLELLAIHRDGQVIIESVATRLSNDASTFDGDPLGALIGGSAKSNLRAAVGTILDGLPVDTSVRSLLRAATFDVPIGLVLVNASRSPCSEVDDLDEPQPVRVDICSGLRAGSRLQRAIVRRGSRRLDYGPSTTGSQHVDSAESGSTLGRQPGTVSRVRRIDVSPTTSPVVESMFRDTVIERNQIDRHGAAIPPETTVHEYEISMTVDPSWTRVETCNARPIVLPAPECPAAATSAQRLVGKELSGVRNQLAAFVGTSTCTHLTDGLWHLGAVPHLLRLAGHI